MLKTTLGSGSSGNCYLVTDGSTTLLLECGLPFKTIQRGLKFKTSSIDACLISHEHSDHAKAAKDMVKNGIDIYTQKETLEVLKLNNHRTHEVRPKKPFKVGAMDILPFDLPHDGVPNLGFQITSKVTGERLIYITDATYCRYRFNKVNYFMIEANYCLSLLNKNMEEDEIHSELRNRVRRSHMSVEQTVEFLKSNDLKSAKHIYLLHLSDKNSDEKMMKKMVQEATGVAVTVL